jgi:pyruvate ferredoxin oxidoreductase gamma subunit
MVVGVDRHLVQTLWHGMGGQGAVATDNLLVEASLDEGRFFRSTPDYRVERSGVPVAAYTLISDEPIHTHTPITNPDIVVVPDSTLVWNEDLLSGLKEDGLQDGSAGVSFLFPSSSN